MLYFTCVCCITINTINTVFQQQPKPFRLEKKCLNWQEKLLVHFCSCSHKLLFNIMRVFDQLKDTWLYAYTVRPLLSCLLHFTLSHSHLEPVSKKRASWGTPAVREPPWARAQRKLSGEWGRGPKSWWTVQRMQTFSTVRTLRRVFLLSHCNNPCVCFLFFLLNVLNITGSLWERWVSRVAAGSGSGWQRTNFRPTDSLSLDWWWEGSLSFRILQQLGKQDSLN